MEKLVNSDDLKSSAERLGGSSPPTPTSIKKVYGPYLVKSKSGGIEGRKQVVIHYTNGRKRTILYSRHLMEQHLGRELNKDETVDHIDRDKSNDVLSNLRIRPRKQHVSEDSQRVELVEIECVWCGKKSKKKGSKLDHNSKQGKAGPFCSKSCVGKYGTEVQNNIRTRMPAQPRVPKEDRKYYYKKKI